MTERIEKLAKLTLEGKMPPMCKWLKLSNGNTQQPITAKLFVKE